MIKQKRNVKLEFTKLSVIHQLQIIKSRTFLQSRILKLVNYFKSSEPKEHALQSLEEWLIM